MAVITITVGDLTIIVLQDHMLFSKNTGERPSMPYAALFYFVEI